MVFVLKATKSHTFYLFLQPITSIDKYGTCLLGCVTWKKDCAKMKAFDFFRPKLVSTLRGYKRETLMADVMAGVIVGIVALPLAIAFWGCGIVLCKMPCVQCWTSMTLLCNIVICNKLSV